MSNRHPEVKLSTGSVILPHGSRPSAGPRMAVDSSVSMGSLLLAIRKQWRLIIAAASIATIAALAFVLISKPQYKAEARVLIDTRGRKVTNIEEVLPVLGAGISEVESQVEILRSPHIARRVARKLPEELLNQIVPAEKPDIAENIIRSIKNYTQQFWTKVGVSSEEEEAGRSIQELAALQIQRSLNVDRVDLSYVVNVNHRDPNGVVAADITNAVVQSFLDDQREMRRTVTLEANKWLQERLLKLSKKLRNAEEAVQAYKETYGLIKYEGKELTHRQLTDHLTQLSVARTKAADARARLHQVSNLTKNSEQLFATSEALKSNVIIDLRRQQALIKRKLGTLGSRLGEQHPQVADTQAELDNITKAIEGELDRLVKNATNVSQVAEIQVRFLEEKLEALKKSHAKQDLISIGLAELERQAESTEAVYASYLKRFKETEAQSNLDQAAVSVISAATPPFAPSSPNKLMVMALAIAMGLGLGVAAALAREGISPRAISGEDIAEYLGSPFVYYRLEKNLDEAQLTTKDRLKLKNWLLDLKEGRKSRIVLVSSIRGGNASSKLAKELCKLSDKLGKRTLLMDMERSAGRKRDVDISDDDIKKRAHGEIVALGCSGGRSAMERKEHDIIEMQKPEVEQGWEIVLLENRFNKVLEEKRACYDIIVISGLDLSNAEGEVRWGQFVDGVIVSLKSGDSKIRDVRREVEEAKISPDCPVLFALN